MLFRFLSLALSLAAANAEFTWWVDKTCNDKLGQGTVDKMLTEAVDIAKMAKGRMQRTREEESQAYEGFNEIFRFYPDDPASSKHLFEHWKRKNDWPGFQGVAES